MHDASDDPPDRPSKPNARSQEDKVGYRNPPKASRFPKGQSGNPSGRPKRLPGTSITDILDGNQLSKNGKVVSKREAFVIAIVNEALRGNQKAFSKFMILLKRSGLIRREQPKYGGPIQVPMRTVTEEEFQEHIRRMGAPAVNPTNRQDS